MEKTVINHAIRKRNRDAVELLSTAGAEIYRACVNSKDLRFAVLDDVFFDTIESLVNACVDFNCDGESILIPAIQKNRQKVVQAFLEAVTSVLGKAQHGRSALELAVLSRNRNIIKALIEKDIEIQRR